MIVLNTSCHKGVIEIYELTCLQFFVQYFQENIRTNCNTFYHEGLITIFSLFRLTQRNPEKYRLYMKLYELSTRVKL